MDEQRESKKKSKSKGKNLFVLGLIIGILVLGFGFYLYTSDIVFKDINRDNIKEIKMFAGGGEDGTFNLSLADASGGCNGTGMSWSAPTCTINTTQKAEHNFTYIDIPSGNTLNVIGDSANSLTMRTTGNVYMKGTISNNGGNGGTVYTGTPGKGGAGGSRGGTGQASPAEAGQGTGGGGGGIGYGAPGAGGGGFGGAGGDGGNSDTNGGSAYSTQEGTDGGSGGGGGTSNAPNGNMGGGGGGGGGATIIDSAGTINITGTINANGGNGGSDTDGGSGGYRGGGGGGSGGRVFLRTSSDISFTGTINAKGGNGGSYWAGGGGGGRVYLEDSDGIIAGTGTISVAGGTQGGGFGDPLAGAVGVNTSGAPDLIYPTFSNYWDNNGTLDGNGTGLFNVTVENTNGTVFLVINEVNIPATNVTSNVYNASYYFNVGGDYTYYWTSYGNGTSNNANNSNNQGYHINKTVIPLSIVYKVPTPDDSEVITDNYAIINVSYSGEDITDIYLDWMGVNETTVSIESLNNHIINFSLNNIESVIVNNNSDDLVILNSSLLMYLNLDNRSSLGESESLVYDITGNGHDATTIGNPTVNNSGKFYGSYSFDNVDDVINVSHHADFNTLNSSFTIEMWINSRNAGVDRQPFFEKDLTSTPTGIMIELNAGGSLGKPSAITVWNGFGANLQSTTALSSNTWHHIAVTYNGSLLNFYLDGVWDNSSVETYGAVGTEDIRIGGGDWAGPVERFFDGSIDEVKIWNVPLTEAEISSHYKTNLNKIDTSNWSSFVNGIVSFDLISQGNGSRVFSKKDNFTYYVTNNQSSLLNGNSYNYLAKLINSSGIVNLTDRRSFSVGAQQISINYPITKTLFHRHNSTTGQIKVLGTYNGTIDAVEGRLDGGTWQIIDANPSGNVFEGYFNATKGQGLLEVRMNNSVSVTDSVANISVGYLFVVGGQSNAEGYFTNAVNLESGNPYNVFVYREDGSWVDGNDQTDSDRLTGGSPWVNLSNFITQNQTEPIAFITTADGGTSISLWQKGQENYDNMTSMISTVTNGTMRVGNMLFFQGERDARTSLGLQGDYDNYKGNLTKMANDYINDTELATSVIVGQINHQPSGNRTTLDNIRRAISDAWDENTNITRGPVTYDINMSTDGLHFATDVEARELEDRWKATVMNIVYNGEDGVSPKISGITMNSTLDPKSITLSFTETSTPLVLEDFSGNSGSKAVGWYVTDGTTVLNDLNVSSTTISGNDLIVNFSVDINNNYKVYFGSWNDSMGKVVLRDSSRFKLPVEPIWNYAITDESSTCTYPGSGNWIIQGSDNCILTVNTNLLGNELIIKGTGNVTINSEIYNWNKVVKSINTKMSIGSGGKIFG